MKLNKNRIYLLALGSALICCEKNEIIKITPVITWTNPEDIAFGTLLSEIQLNATASIPGTFVYTPRSGTRLNIGANQVLRVKFTPNDAAVYDTAGKTVKINVKPYATVNDTDGNLYNAVIMGKQIWMAENLRTTKLHDGTVIRNETDPSFWSGFVTPLYCWYYNNKEANKNTYGALYNWHAVNTGKLCPAGWHVPSDSEWTALIDFLGGKDIAGGKLKETGQNHWASSRTDATNEFGFTALPGGALFSTFYSSDFLYNGFEYLGLYGFWWSSSERSFEESWQRYMYYDNSSVSRGMSYKMCGYSVRCLRDE